MFAVVGADGDDVDALLGGGAETSSDPEPPAEPDAPAADTGSHGRRVFATPLARRLLAEAGLEPGDVTGSGPHGRITKRDVQAATAEAPARDEPTTPEPTTDLPEGVRAEPHTRLRRAIASRLTQSKRDVPHFYLRRTARVDALLRLRGELNEVSPQKISVNDLVVRAVAVAHAAVPEANVTWSDDALLHHARVDVGVAIASERGLVTPVLRDVDRLTPSAVARRVRELASQAADGRLNQRDLEGGSISVTNLGMFGVEEFAAIINPPQSAILAVGAAQRSAIVEDDAVVVGTTLALVLSVDHRAVDGALAARWLAALVEVLEAPLRLIA